MQKSNDQRKKTSNELQVARQAGNQEKVTELQKQLGDSHRADFALRNRYLDQCKALLNDEQKGKCEEATRPKSSARLRAQ